MNRLREGALSDVKVTIRLTRIEADVYFTCRWAVGASTWSELVRGALERLRRECEGRPMEMPTRPALLEYADGNDMPLTLSPVAAEAMSDVIDVIPDLVIAGTEPEPEPAAIASKKRSERTRKERPRSRPAKKPKLPTLPTESPKAPANGRTKSKGKKGGNNAKARH